MINRAVFDQVEEAIDSFEGNWSPDSRDEITKLLQAYGLTQDLAALTELIRIDIELRYKHGVAVRLEEYFNEFEGLLDDPYSVAQIAFEDFRSRSVGGHTIVAARWEGLPGIKDQDWFQQLAWERVSIRPTTAIRSPRISCEPDPPLLAELEAIGFRLVQPIAEGAFSRVYLATQKELADRFVVLKVVDQTLAEPQNMAMLQHTNIVPIYSFHRILSRSVICMPYAGSVTLRDFLTSRPSTIARRGESLVVTVRNQVCDTNVASAATNPQEPDALAETSDRANSNGQMSSGGEGDGSKSAFSIPAADDSAVLKPLELIRSLECNELATWIFSRLAAALAHSHARGVLHGDLKPGNVLIRNDGEPALLDFNLSQSLDRGSAKLVGGTLPYMAPETYRGWMGQSVTPSGSSDIYALGVMLFEFVTGRFPYPNPPSIADTDLEPAIEVRKGAADWRKQDTVSPSLRSIINRCLAYAPEKRYSSADELRQDLECQHQNIPLMHAAEPRIVQIQKWTRRHPQAILGGVATLLLLMLIPVGVAAAAWRNQSMRMAAVATFNAFADESAAVLSAVMVDPKRHEEAGVRDALKPLEEFGVLDGSGLAKLESPGMTPQQRDRQRDTLLRHIAQVAFAETDRLRPEAAKGPLGKERLQRLDHLIAAADKIRGSYRSRACLFLHAKRAELAGDEQRFEQLHRQAEEMDLTGDSEAYLEAVRMLADHQYQKAWELLSALADGNSVPSNLRWTMLGRSQYADNKYEDAKISFTQSIEHAPDASRLWFLRGMCYYRLRNYDRAETEFSKAIELEPDFAPAWLQRGLSRLAQVRPQEDFANHEKTIQGMADYDRALELSPGNAQILLIRRRAHERAGRSELAARDFEEAMKAEGQSQSALRARAQARKKTDPEGALADLQEANLLDPDTRIILTEMSRILSVRLGRPDDAMQVLDRLLDTYPDHESALIDRAVLLARAKRYREAMRDLEKAIRPPNSNRTLYQAACVRANLPRPQNRQLALSLLAQAIHAGYETEEPDDIANDPDLEPIRNMDQFKAIVSTYQLSESHLRRRSAVRVEP